MPKSRTCRRSFIQDYSYRGYLPGVKQLLSEMAINGSGIRADARVLKISPTTVIEEFKKKSRHLEQINTTLLQQQQTMPESVMVVRVEDALLDEMWSFVQSKQNSALVMALEKTINRGKF